MISPHISKGRVVKKTPYIMWKVAPDRKKEEIRMECSYGPDRGDICYPVTVKVPDTKWNNAVDARHAELTNYVRKIPAFVTEVDTLGVLIALLERYYDLIEENAPNNQIETSEFIVDAEELGIGVMFR